MMDELHEYNALRRQLRGERLRGAGRVWRRPPHNPVQRHDKYNWLPIVFVGGISLLIVLWSSVFPALYRATSTVQYKKTETVDNATYRDIQGRHTPMAHTYVVSQDYGDDRHTCVHVYATGAAFQTINRTCMHESDTVYVRGGVYKESIFPIRLPAGTAERPTTLRGDPHDRPHLIVPHDTHAFIFDLDASHVRVSDFDVYP